MTAWIFLVIAILFEVTATTFLKLSDGFSKLAPSAIAVAGYGVAFWMLSLVLKTFQVGVAYAIWAGIGTALVAVAGWLVLSERLAWPVWLGIALVVAGVIVVETFSGPHG